ncbi:MAG: hypothetical protein U9P90_02075 [Patescibacteria group bacterium]|nr:hypothetical protein [Patescibacteria group bacterium]
MSIQTNENVNVNENATQANPTQEKQEINQNVDNAQQQQQQPSDIMQMMKEADSEKTGQKEQEQEQGQGQEQQKEQINQTQEQQQKQITPEEAEKIIATDPSLRQVKMLENSGMSREEALRQVYEANEKQQSFENPQEDFSALENGNNVYLTLSEQDKSELRRIAQNPTDQDVANWANKKNITLPQIPEFADEATQVWAASNHNLQIQNIKNQIQQDAIHHCNNLNVIENLSQKQQEYNQNLHNSLVGKVVQDFPEMNTNSIGGQLLYKHYQQAFAMKRQMLSPHLQNNSKILNSINTETINEMKAIKPQLIKAFGIIPQQSQNNQANQMQMNNMNAVNGSYPTNAGNAQTITVRPGNEDDIMNLMNIVDKAEKKT